MNDHRTTLQHLNGHMVDTSLKDNDNTTQPQQLLLTDTISAEPCPQTSPQRDCGISELIFISKIQHPRTIFWKTARETRTAY